MADYSFEEKNIDDLSFLEPEATYSYADYLKWTFEERVELIRGKIFKMAAAPLRCHQAVLVSLSTEIQRYLKGQPCKLYVAPFDVRLTRKPDAPDDEVESVVQPDLSIICDPSRLDERGCKGAPDLIAEILSPSTSKKDIEIKYGLYEESGVKEYLILFPGEGMLDQYVLNTSEKYELKHRYYRNESFSPQLFPDLRINLTEIFDDDNPYNPNERRI